MTLHRKLVYVFCILFTVATLVGCAAPKSRYTNSSVVNFLYPDFDAPIQSPTIPNLKLPLRVGVAFVPEMRNRNSDFTQHDKEELLEEVARHFEQHEFVAYIDRISSDYLSPGGSFRNLDQIKLMHGIDVIVLLSYDQVQFTDNDISSLAYWTLVGAYVIPGEKNDTRTMVDAVVYDISSRKMLFRAPGTSHVKGRTTPVNISESLREDSIKGFKQASESLLVNLEKQLASFEERVKADPQSFEITTREGYTGAGSIGLPLLLLMMLPAFAALSTGSHTRS